MVNKQYSVSCVVLVLFFIVVLSGSIAVAEDQIKEVRIADAKGDWGYPNPYRHYPRGAGYVRNELGV